ncbi:hypothetical protein BVC80_1707g58 [Macleaya cordata]|uniref:Uncharacterized protein n=1 Tax=Macleaya cordata TaxID=56857 RepID=A0A200Q649_MACCD|nr:hypothetical protein BVC80_1707g58 [Macleaya cordata]
MALKHLKQLLDEDQEPFVLKNYIDERRCQLKRPVSKTQLQVKRRKPISENTSFFCKNACFLSFHDSPDVKMSPLFSPVKSPCRNSNTLYVHIPSKTAAILLEAALRIQKHSASKKPKNPKNIGFGFFGSMLKRITHRKKRNISGDEIKVSVKDILRWDSSNGRKRVAEEMREKEETTLDLDEIRVSEVGFSCSCNSRVSSAWSESNEEKSMDLETSSSRSEDSEEMDFVGEQIKTGDFSSYEKEFCSSPFRFVLQNCSSPTGEITPEFMSPVTSPSRLKKQVVKNEEGQLNCLGKELEEEEKEQFSPVSVLDPQFEEDDDEEEGQEDEEEEEKDGFELERSFANVQRSIYLHRK